MDNRPNLSSGRMLMALGAFVLVLCVFLYAGFRFKMRALDFKKLFQDKRASSQVLPEPLFYKQIGSTAEEKDLSSEAAVSASNISSGDHYALEFKVTTDQDEAEKTVRSLGDKGVDAYYTPLQKNGRVVFRIRMGLFSSKDIAQQAADHIKKDKGLNSAVVTLQ